MANPGLTPDDPANDDDARPNWISVKQWAAIKAIEEHGGIRPAERALGLAHDVLGAPYRWYQKAAARRGHAPGHFEGGVAPGYVMGKVTVQRGPGGVERTWEHLHRYLAEFDFRYSNRSALGCEDQERAMRAVLGVVGKRLTYQTTRVRAVA